MCPCPAVGRATAVSLPYFHWRGPGPVPTSPWGTSASGWLSTALGPGQVCALGLVSLSKVLKTDIPASKSFKWL